MPASSQDTYDGMLNRHPAQHQAVAVGSPPSPPLSSSGKSGDCGSGNAGSNDAGTGGGVSGGSGENDGGNT